MSGGRGKGEKPEHIRQQQERQAQAKLDQLKRAPATLVSFTFAVTATCPATGQEVTLEGPSPRREPMSTRDPDGTRRSIEEMVKEAQSPTQPWNQPHAQLHGWGYETDGGTGFNGITLTVWHCPACGGQHEIELEDLV